MAVISLEQIAACYKAAKQVSAGHARAAVAARGLRDSFGMNEGSAQNYIHVFGRLRGGAVYKRMLSIDATRYFLSNISRDFGDEGLRLALDSTWKHIEYLVGRGEGAVPALRAVMAEFDADGAMESLETFELRLKLAVQASLTDTSKARAERLQVAPRFPQKVEVRSWQFTRSADVIAAVLLRAAGVCERCAAVAPFHRRADGTPYLEVHHVIQLAHGGEDTVRNALALCPNCHRRAHFGPPDA